MSSGSVRFDLGNNGITIPKDDSTKVTLKAKLNSVNGGDESGLLLRPVFSTTAGTGNTGVIVESTSVGSDISAASITVNASSTASDFFAIRRTKPTISLNGSAPFTELIDSTNLTVYKFTISADANKDVSWKGIKFDVDGRIGGADVSAAVSTSSIDTSGGAVFTNAELWDSSEVNNGTYTVVYAYDATGGNGEIAIILPDGIEEEVSAGSSKNYELRLDISGANTAGDFINVNLDNEADDAGVGVAAYLVTADPEEVDGGADGSGISMTAGVATNPYIFLWSDNSGSPHSASNDVDSPADERDWTNDRFLEIENASWNINRD